MVFRAKIHLWIFLFKHSLFCIIVMKVIVVLNESFIGVGDIYIIGIPLFLLPRLTQLEAHCDNNLLVYIELCT